VVERSVFADEEHRRGGVPASQQPWRYKAGRQDASPTAPRSMVSLGVLWVSKLVFADEEEGGELAEAVGFGAEWVEGGEGFFGEGGGFFS
jgi:hypothetical protein